MTDKEVRTFGEHIIQYQPEYSLCTGCTTCEIACTPTHDGLVSPSHTRIFVHRTPRGWLTDFFTDVIVLGGDRQTHCPLILTA